MVVAGASILVIAVATFFTFRRSHTTPPKVVPPVQAVAPPPAPAEISLTGKIQATKVVNVAPPVDGTIEQFVTDVGDDVTEGEVLARIKNIKLENAQEKQQLDVERAQNQVSGLEAAVRNARLEVSRSEADAARSKGEFERAEKEYAKQQMMIREGVTPRLVFEKAQQDYNRLKVESDSMADVAAKAAERVAALTRELESARKNFTQRQMALEQSGGEEATGEVYAPADGVVIARRGQQGEQVTRKMADLFQIAVELNALEVAVPADTSQIRVGQAAVIEVKDVPGTITGKVREIKASQAFVAFTNTSAAVRPGMTAQVRIVP